MRKEQRKWKQESQDAMGIIYSEANSILPAVGCVQKEAPSQGPRPKMKISVGPFLEGLKVSFECFLYCGLPYPGEAGIISTILTSDAASQALPEI